MDAHGFVVIVTQVAATITALQYVKKYSQRNDVRRIWDLACVLVALAAIALTAITVFAGSDAALYHVWRLLFVISNVLVVYALWLAKGERLSGL